MTSSPNPCKRKGRGYRNAKAGVTDMWLPVDVKNGLGIWIS